MTLKKDYFDELGEVALGSRLKRLSDRIMSDALNVYKYMGQDIQPKWFTLMSLLYEKKSVSIVEASEFLGLTQPCISQFSKELIKKEWVKASPDKNDLRRKILSLTNKGKRRFKNMEPVRTAVRTAAISLCEEVEHDFYQAIKQFEKSLSKKSLYQRTLEKYHEQK
ncbi:MAG: MarR family winged helix-turn-helix transcriptional regulator [Marinicellaceae bacterium]